MDNSSSGRRFRSSIRILGVATGCLVLACALLFGCSARKEAPLEQAAPTAPQESAAPEGMSESLEAPSEASPMLVQVTEDYRQLLALDGQLGEQLELGSCNDAASLREQICQLSQRICEIADAHPDEDAVREQCLDGRARCERARVATRNRCR